MGYYFPSRIRYTSVSVPYHIGNGWGGGLVPFITSAAFLSTGSGGRALIYPIAVPAGCFLLCLFLLPGGRPHNIWGARKGPGLRPRVWCAPAGGGALGPRSRGAP